MKWCAASQKWTMFDHMVSIASLDKGLWVQASELDGDKRFLGVQNGVVDLFTGELLHGSNKGIVEKIINGRNQDTEYMALPGS